MNDVEYFKQFIGKKITVMQSMGSFGTHGELLEAQDGYLKMRINKNTTRIVPVIDVAYVDLKDIDM